jgi:hypothetical protein
VGVSVPRLANAPLVLRTDATRMAKRHGAIRGGAICPRGCRTLRVAALELWVVCHGDREGKEASEARRPAAERNSIFSSFRGEVPHHQRSKRALEKSS